MIERNGVRVTVGMAVQIDRERFEAHRLLSVPGRWRNEDRAEYLRKEKAVSLKDATTWLDEHADAATRMRGLLVATDDDLRLSAERISGDIELRLAKSVGRARNFALDACVSRCDWWMVSRPGEQLSDEGIAARLSSPEWWLHGLRKAQRRLLEAEARRRGYVRRQKGIYVSDEALRLRRAQRKRNATILSDLELIGTETGTIVKMEDVAKAGMANPDNRRAELMVRIRGFEDLAKQRGDVCEFVTITCPSKYHARKRKGEKNAKWSGATPRDAQAYLCGVWARIRAQWARDGVMVYGLRIAEPHHDGTPHWHLALFVAKKRVNRLREVITEYALNEDEAEAGATENRVKFVAINPAKGSAAGYVLKYVCKNLGGIDGEADYENGAHSTSTAERVEAWASLWGIRQFQQIGGHKVGVWRELRRCKDEPSAEAPRLFKAWQAVNKVEKTGKRADWAAFTEALGGLETKQKDALVWMVLDEEETHGRYGVDVRLFPKGVGDCAQILFSDRERWTVRRAYGG